MTSPEARFSFGPDFFRSVDALAVVDKGRVMDAVSKLQNDPNHPSLRLKPLNADPTRRLHSIRAAQDLRVLVAREGGLFVLLEAGPRQSIYDKVGRKRFAHNPGTGFVGIVDLDAEARQSEPFVPRLRTSPDDDRPGVFDHWSDADLRDAGFDVDAVGRLRRCTSEDALCEAGLNFEEFERAIEIMELTPELWRAPTMIADRAAAEQRLRIAIEQFGAAHGLSPFYSADEVAKIAAAPIEEWMIFLHPDQRAVVQRHYEGPARISGAAGTGKTVVALHRAAELAHRFEAEGDTTPILFTTFIKTLPPVFEGLYDRLPNALPGRVEFVHVDKLARRVVTQSGRRVNTSPPDVKAAWATALRTVVTDGSPLAKSDLTPNYLRDEITEVIKGRGIASLDIYRDIERTGRRVAFSAAMRDQAWELMEAWDAEMAKRDTVDFPDVRLMARDVARDHAEPGYRAALVDESQDITLVGLQFIRALTTAGGQDRPDGLLLVGDGAQRIYPGGFTLRQAGVAVTGRSTILRTNYRNTAEILGAAMAIAGEEQVVGLDENETYRRGEAPAESVRVGGVLPALVECASEDDESTFVLRRLGELVEAAALRHGDVGLFVPTNREANRWAGVLRQARVPHLDLTSSKAGTADAVKIGTYFRAKGLEFKVVFLPGLDEGFPRPPRPGQDLTEYEEDRALAVSRLFVAMTRARDALFITTPGSPSPLLVEHLDAFDLLQS
jgi:hypothetical protein